jgi:hypothetical protein
MHCSAFDKRNGHLRLERAWYDELMFGVSGFWAPAWALLYTFSSVCITCGDTLFLLHVLIEMIHVNDDCSARWRFVGGRSDVG